MRLGSLLFLCASAFGQSFSSANLANLPGQVSWGFVGNLTIGLGPDWTAYTPMYGNNQNAGTATCTTPQACASPFRQPITRFCIEFDGTQPQNIAFRVYHVVGGVFVATPLFVTSTVGQPFGTYCSVPGGVTAYLTGGYAGPFESLAPSGTADQFVMQIVSQQSTNYNSLTSVSFISYTANSVNPHTANLYPQAANGTGIWPNGAQITVASGTSVPEYCDLTGVACSPVVDLLTQEPATKSGIASHFCVYIGTLRGGNGAVQVGLNVNGLPTALQVTVPAAAAVGFYCDNSDFVTLAASDLLDYQIFANGSTFTLSNPQVSFTF